MKTPFLQPRFEGDRFSEHTLPLDVARDLVAYETLIIELAKHLYLADHPDRKRVPKGFSSDFHLHLEKIDEGSSRPMLSAVFAGVLVFGGSLNSYFERARELTTECIAAPKESLPTSFPKELLKYFNQFGRSLQVGECVTIPDQSGEPQARLTLERRKELVLAADRVYERDVMLAGTIDEVDWAKNTFRLKLTDGGSASIPLVRQYEEEVRKCEGRPRHQVSIGVTATYDSYDRLQKVISVNSSIEVQEDYLISQRFDELRKIQDGWLDGEGIALDERGLDMICDGIIGHYPERLPIPVIVPTPEGGLLFEWDATGSPSVDISLFDMKAMFHALCADQPDIEQEFDLDDRKGFSDMLSFLEQTIGVEES